MKGFWAALALALGAGTVCLARADAGDASDLRRLFPQRAPIEADDASGASLFRLELTPEVLAACRADLSDLRVLDERHQPVPFVVDPGPARSGPATERERLPAEVLAAARREVPRTSNAAARLEETYELGAPPWRSEGEWQLVLDAGAPEFVRELVIEGVRTGLPAPRVEGSVFRIRGLADQRLSSSLPPLPYERLRVQLGGEELFPLRPQFFFETARSLPAPRLISVPLAAVTAATVGSEQRIVLARPAGIVPSTLRIETRTTAFERHVEVYDVAQGQRPVRVGAANVFRVPFATPIEGLELELAPASGQTLEVRIQNGDSPPLADLGMSAVVRAPSLVFAEPPGRRVILYFGGGRARTPRYDLDRLLSRRNERQASVRLGLFSDNPHFARTPALAFATRPGAPVDPRLYRYQRTLAVTPSSDGLARIVLGAADLAVLRPDLGDVRVVDAAGRQWPYLIDRDHGFESVPLELGAAERDGAASRLPLGLPAAPLVPGALVLDSSDAYFDRDYRVTAQGIDGQMIELSRGRLRRDISDGRAPIVIELRPARVRSLSLEVSDADDAPIRWTSAFARIDVPRLYVLAEPGRYRLLLGNALDTAPSYDVARARDLILSVAFQDTPLEPLTDNPAYRTSARLAAGDAPSRALLWAALGVAVVALGGLTLRLARQDQTPAR